MTQFSEQFRLRVISQFINGISRVLQKLLKYFNGAAILINYTLALQYQDLQYYLFYFGYAFNKWCTVFKNYFFVISF